MAILSFTGQATEIDISQFWLDDATGNVAFIYSSWWANRDDQLQFFDEAQDVTLSQDINISNPLDWDDLDNLGTIAAGSVVDSHFIYLKKDDTSQRESYTATFTFDGEIIGFMADDELFGNAGTRQTLNGNDELVGYDARVLASGNTLEGPNSGLPEDIVTISGENNNILTVTLTSQSAVDPLRVITQDFGTSTTNPPTVNQNPTASDDQASTNEDTTINIDVLANDLDPDGDSFSVTLVDGTNTQGIVSINNDGTISYNPNSQFDSLEDGESTTDTFSYTITDSQGGTDTATVTVTINGVSSVTQPPDNNNDVNIIIDVDPSAEFPGIGEIDQLNGTNAADLFVLGDETQPYYSDGDSTTNSWNDRAEIIGFNDLEDTIQLHGSASDYELAEKNGDTRIFYIGEATKEMIGIISGYSNSASLTDDIFSYVSGTEPEPTDPEPTNQNPTANDDQASTDEETTINIDVLANDLDPDGDSFSVTLVDGTNTQGIVSINNDGTISYNPNSQFDSLEDGESTTDSFSYTITDSQGGTDTATVTVTINGVSSVTQPPDNNNDVNIIIDVDPSAEFPGIGEIDQLNGTNAADLFVLGDETQPYYSDGDSTTNSWNDRAEIIGFNDLEDTIQLHGSASDYELAEKNGDTRIFYIGEATKEMIGIISGYSNSASLTDDIFSYVSGTEPEPTDPEPTNQNPTANDDQASTDEETTINIDVLANDLDSDGDSFSVTLVDGTNTQGIVSINNDGTISYNPNSQFDSLEDGESTTDSFSYTITDSQGATDTATVTVTVNGVTPAAPTPELTMVQIEAETATTLTNYTIQQPLGDFASGDAYIRLSASTGEAVFTTDENTLQPGVYDVVIGYFEENDGEAQLSVQKGNEVLDQWTLNQASTGSQPNATTFVERTVATNLNIAAGDQFSISGVLDAGEVAAVDYLKFVPSEPSQSYANANQGIFANLEQGVGFVPDEAIDDAVKIMALGDSITFGVDGEQGFPGVTPTEEQGGYRTELWNRLQDLGVPVDFVGSLSNGPEELGDTDHEGHPGWRTSYLRFGVNRDGYTTETSGVEVWLPEYEPDAVLVMSGANDASNTADVSTNMFNQIEKLVKQINNLTDNDPTYNNGEGAELILASITPADPERQSEIRAQNVEDYNQLIRDNIVGNATYDLDAFVDIGNAVTVDDLAPVETGDNGLHPTQSTYDLMAELWYEGLLDALGSQDDLSQVNNLTGSNFDDVLRGNAADNRIEGGNGSDELTGNAGADTFVYQQPTEGVDRITDFDSSQGDQLEISASGFGGSLTVGTLALDQFVLGTEAVDSNDRFLYDSGSGNVFFDIDGNGSETATLFLTLDGSPTLSANDFNIV